MIRLVWLVGFKIFGALTRYDLYDTIRWLKHIIMQTCLFKLSDLYFNWKYNAWGTCSYCNYHCNNCKKKKQKTLNKKKPEELLGWSFGYVEKFRVILNNSAKVLKTFSLALWSLYDLAFTSHKHSCSSQFCSESFIYFHFFICIHF